jgi:hypothetical protein
VTGDTFGYSPDIGKFVTREGKMYSENGVVYESGGMFRSMPREADSHENYADWTEKQRSEKFIEVFRRQEECEKQRDAERAARRILVEQAKQKLTEAEFQAVLNSRDDE